MSVRTKLGYLDPIVYFVNREGTIQLPPTSDIPTPRGFDRREADTLAAVDDLQRRLQDQESREWELGMQKDDAALAASREAIRSRLTQRMISSSTTPYERDFIQSYLQVREDRRAHYRSRFEMDQCFFEAREMDRPRTVEEMEKK